MPLNFSADFTGTLPKLLGTMRSQPESREAYKLDLAVEFLRRGGVFSIKAWGSSMLPSLWPGDLLTIEGVAPEHVIPGDIILVCRNHRCFIHRLVETPTTDNQAWWITKGDAVPQVDPPANASELLGRVCEVRRGSRRFTPRRHLSRTYSTLGSMLGRSDRLRNFLLHLHAARLRETSSAWDGFSGTYACGFRLPKMLGGRISRA